MIWGSLSSNLKLQNQNSKHILHPEFRKKNKTSKNRFFEGCICIYLFIYIYYFILFYFIIIIVINIFFSFRKIIMKKFAIELIYNICTESKSTKPCMRFVKWQCNRSRLYFPKFTIIEKINITT